MKPTMAIKPLVFALTAIMAVAAQAGIESNKNWHPDHHHNHKHDKDTAKPVNATATATDYQSSTDNVIFNQATKNTADMTGSANGSKGNLGANVAAGDGNQQDNAVALATAASTAAADEKFIFGTASATTYVNQYSDYNTVYNYSTQNKATLSGSANNGSGNIGVNVVAGDLNQQKNTLAIAVSPGNVATASANADQSSPNLHVDNYALATWGKLDLKTYVDLHGKYSGTGEGYVIDKDNKGHEYNWKNNNKEPLYFTESGTTELKGVITYQKAIQTGWKDPVVNSATMNGSLSNFYGNGGANVASGVGNQQSNSMAIAAAGVVK